MVTKQEEALQGAFDAAVGLNATTGVEVSSGAGSVVGRGGREERVWKGVWVSIVMAGVVVGGVGIL
jgi:hypothetical protein